jgi:hypothetical protein
MTDPDALQQLLDIEAIKQLKARYFRLLDQKRWDEWGSVFTADVHMVVPEGEVDTHGRDAVVESLRGILAEVVTVHHGHMPEIEITGADTASGTWAMFDHLEFPGADGGPPFTMRGYGHYTETYARGADGWQIATLRLDRLRVDLG